MVVVSETKHGMHVNVYLAPQRIVNFAAFCIQNCVELKILLEFHLTVPRIALYCSVAAQVMLGPAVGQCSCRLSHLAINCDTSTTTLLGGQPHALRRQVPQARRPRRLLIKIAA
jgi:hypothetical protein